MTRTDSVLFELGTEELPPRLLGTLRDALRDEALAGLDKAGLIDNGSPAVTDAYASPQHLALVVRGVRGETPRREERLRGPAARVAFDDTGAPTRALLGFAGKCAADDDQIERWSRGLDLETTDKGSWVAFRREVPPRPAADLLPAVLAEAVAALPVDARMRWGDTAAEFVRPVRWVVLLYGDEVVEGEILGIPCGSRSRGHRFLNPGMFPVPAPGDYAEVLRTHGVMVDMDEREASLRRQIADLESNWPGGAVRADTDPGLVSEAVCSVEQPHALRGEFDRRFLELPVEVVTSVLRGQQKYLPVYGEDGLLRPAFIAVAGVPDASGAIAAGCERVVQARLQDAEFYRQQDRRRTLGSRVSDLERVGFHRKLGNLGDRTRRLIALGARLAEILEAPVETCARAAELGKADLTTDMVQSFPDLQGVTGAHYARADGEQEAVCVAIREQYLPRHAADELPQSPAGTVLALADRMDLLAGVFGVAEAPSGSRDPLGVRRACLGVLRMILEGDLAVSVRDLYVLASEQYPQPLRDSCTDAQEQALEYFADRLRGHMLERGFAADEIEAVLETGWEEVRHVPARLAAVREFRAHPEGAALAEAHKRIRNLLREAPPAGGDLDPDALQEPAERRLSSLLDSASGEARELCAAGRYADALRRLSELSAPVAEFFDQVLVLAEDEKIRHNRLRLLQQLREAFLMVADLSRLQG